MKACPVFAHSSAEQRLHARTRAEPPLDQGPQPPWRQARLLENARLRLQLGGQRLDARACAAALQQLLERRHVHRVTGAEVRQHLLRVP